MRAPRHGISSGGERRRGSSGDEDQPRPKMEKRDEPVTVGMTSQQQDAFKEFRSRVSGLVPEEDSKDHLLLQWLTARNFSVDKAETMFKKAIDWRKEMDIEHILEWEPPEVIKKYSPMGFLGHDKMGGTVLLVPHGRADIRGLLMSAKTAVHVRATCRTMELSKRYMAAESKRRGFPICQQTCIFDLEGFSFKDFTWKPAMDLVVDQMQMYEANYPELLRRAYIINAPKVFTVAYAMLKPFLRETSIKKIKIFGQSGWKEVLLNDIDADVLPKHWGGTRVDPDGDEKCSSVVCLGGEVPKSYYLKNKAKDAGHYTTVTVGKGTIHKIDCQVVTPDSILKWDFHTDDYDIGFGVDCSVDPRTRVAQSRVGCHLAPETGQLVCKDSATYTLVFDNSYSYMRGKKLYYNICVCQADSTS